MSRIHPLRLGLRIVLPLLVLLVAAGVAGRFGLFGGFDLMEAIGIVRTRESRSATALLTRVRDIYRLDTVEMVYRTVFPYDYMDPSLDLRSIIAATRSSNGSVAQLLSPAQELYLRAYNLSHALGMRTGPEHYDFVVVTTVVRAGIDLSDPAILHPEAASRQEIRHWITTTEGDSNRATVRLPSAVITELRTEDPDKSSYIYPDLRIPPAGWKRITEFVADHVRRDAETGELLTSARERAGSLVQSFLHGAGFDSVTIVE